MADEQILDVLVTKFTADLGPLEAGLTKAETDAKRSGQQIGQQLGQGLKAGLTTGTNPEQLGQQQGQQWGEGWKIGADGRLRDAKGRFIKTGEQLGKGLTDGLTDGVKQGQRQVDDAVNGLTARLQGGTSGGGFGGFGGLGQALSAGLGQGLAPALGNLGGLSAGLGNVTGAMGSAAAAAGPLAAGIAGVTAAVGASVMAINQAVNEYAKFEKGLAGISTLTDQVPSQMGETGRAILNLSTDLGVSFQDLSAGLQDILGAGVKGTEDMGASLLFLKDASKLAIAGQTDTATATDALTTILNSYKLSAADTKAVSDGLFRTVQDGKISFNTLAGSIGNVTSIAADSGVSLIELNAAIATMTANGLQGSTAVDYLRSAITSIIKPSDEAQKLADKLGIQFDAQALKSKGLTGVLKDVQAATKGNTAEMAILFGGVEAMSAATSIASGNFDRMTANLKNQATAAGSTETAYAKMAGTLAKENDKVDANWKKLMVNLGEAFAPFKTSVMQSINEMLEGINKMLERWNLARTVTGTGNKVLDLERQIELKRNDIQRVELQLNDPNFASYTESGKAYMKKAIAEAKAELARLEADLVTAKAQMGAVKAEQARYNVANSSAVLPAGTYGPNMGKGSGAAVDMASLPAESGKFGYAFISKLADVFVNDPKVASDCAIIASRILQTLGIKIDSSVNAGVLEQNAKKAGFTQVQGDEIKPGDLIVWTSGNGKTYGMTSGKHTAVAAGYQNGKLMVIENPGSKNTQVVPMYDTQNAVAYRAPTSPFAAGGGAGAGGTGGGSTPPKKEDLAAYSLTLKDWNANQARALELAREAAKAESDLTGKRGLQVKAAMEQWAGEDKARQQSYQLAVQLTARQEQAAAKAKSEAEQQARKDEARQKEAQQAAARLNEALRQGKIESARNELTRLQTMRDNDLRNAGDNAQRVAQVEQRYAKLTYDAKAAIALKEKQDRDADIQNDKTLNGTARAQALRNSNQTYLNALKAAGNERNAALDRVSKDLEATAARNAAVMPGLMSGWVDDWAKDQEKDRDAAAAGAAVVTKLFDGAIDQLGKSRAEMEAALTEALTEIYQKAIDAGIDPFSGGSPDQFRDMNTPGRAGLAALIGGNPAGFMAAFTATGGAPDDLLKEFADADWESLGLDVLQGLADGMRSDAAWDGVRGVVEGALGRILADSAFAADIVALVSDRDMTFGAPAGIVTGNELPEAEGTPLAQTVAQRKALELYAATLRDMTEAGLDAAEAEAIAGDNADFYNVILAERARRLQEQKDKAEAAAKAERELADAIAKTQADAIAQAAKDTADYNAAQDALAKSARDLGAAMGQTEAPYQNQIDSLEELKTKMPKMADEIDALIKKWKELQGTMQAADMAGQIAGAVSQIGALFDKVNGAEGKGALSILGDWMQMNVTAYKQFQSGDVVGAVMTTLNGILNIGESIAELNAGLREWKKNLREVAEEQKKVLGMSSGGFKSPWEDALKKDAGNREQLANSRWYQRLWWGLTGGGPQVISDEAAKLLTDLQEIFAQLGDGIADAFTDAMLSAFEAGDMSQFAENFSAQFDAVVGKVVLKTMIEAALTQGAVADDLASLTKAIQEQRYGDVPAIMASIKAHAGQIGANIAAVAPSLPGYGSGANGGSGPDTTALFGASPTAQLGIPRFEVTLPDTVMKPLGDFAAVIPAFSRATDRLYEAADMIVRSGWGLQKPTGLAPL